MGNALKNSAREENDIENESSLIDFLILSAKEGRWEVVWKILGPPENPKHGHFINVISENRRWCILHQACYWNDLSVVTRLLSYKECDSHTTSKLCTSDVDGTVDCVTAHTIASQHDYLEVQEVLDKHSQSQDDDRLVTLVRYEDYTHNSGLSLITLTLAAYKKTFHPSPIDKNESLISILETIYNEIVKCDERRQKVMDVVSDSVYVVCKENAEKIQESCSLETFFGSVINTYTVEENYMYSFLNIAFRRQRSRSYCPSGKDLAIGPYAVVYQMLLLFWKRLRRETAVTYRHMTMHEIDADQYQTGVRFAWPSIISSTVEKEKAVTFPTVAAPGDTPVLFVIDNSADSIWQPRNIESFANDEDEHERTYPAGAKFLVTTRSKKEEYLEIGLQLIKS